MTQHPDLFAALAAPFDGPGEIKIRTQAGRELRYITARTVMNRLDNVLGPENWWDSYTPGENSVVCSLTIRLPSGECLAKSDAGGYAGMADSGDDDKSGYSDAFKRAAVKFGIARYLYRDGVPTFVQERIDAQPGSPPPGKGEAFEGDLPPTNAAPRSQAQQPAKSNGQNASAPRTGKALFAWTKDQEQRFSVGLLKYLNSWAKLQEFPGRMVDWDAEQVTLAHAEACRKLNALQRNDGYEEALAN